MCDKLGIGLVFNLTKNLNVLDIMLPSHIVQTDWSVLSCDCKNFKQIFTRDARATTWCRESSCNDRMIFLQTAQIGEMCTPTPTMIMFIKYLC